MPYRLPDQDTRATPEYGAYLQKKVLYQYFRSGFPHSALISVELMALSMYLYSET